MGETCWYTFRLRFDLDASCSCFGDAVFTCVLPGAMLGKLEVAGGGEVSGFTDPNERNLVSEVSVTEPRVFGKGNAIKVGRCTAANAPSLS